MNDQMLAEIVSTPVSTIEDVISVMQRIDDLLTDEDGLKWFNFLYLEVTKSILGTPPPNGWSDPNWLTRLDLIFAGMYFETIRDWIKSSYSSAPRSWRVLLDARTKSDVMRIQFALCGMNAHINRDLQFALLQTAEELNIEPELNSPQHSDYEHVNGILEAVEARVIPILITGELAEIEEKLGRLDNILALWGVRAARETAWLNSDLLWHVRNIPFLRRSKMETADRTASLIGGLLLAPVG